MKNLSHINLVSPSRRNLMKLASVGALGAADGLAACSEAASAVTSTPATTVAIDPDAIAIMSSNENSFGPSPKAKEAMRAGVGNIYRYACPQTMAFAEMIARREGVAPEQVLVTNGSSPILAAFADYVRVQGGDLVTSALTYEGVPRVAQNIGTNVIEVPLASDLGFDMEAIAAAIGLNTSGVYICSPNNPTGKVVPPAVLKAFVEEASAKVPVFIDEAYLDMSDDCPAGVMTEFVKAGKPVIVARTFSKIYAMAGQRLGYGLMQPDMAMTICKTGRLSNVNYLALVGGMAALDDTAYYEEMRVKTARGRPIAPDP